MSIAARIKQLRKEEALTRAEFGGRLGVSLDVVANIEYDRLARPEQKEPLYKLICKEFNVNYEWLTTGQGEMRNGTTQTLVEELAAKYELSNYVEKLLESYMILSTEERRTVDDFLRTAAQAVISAEEKPGE